MALLVHIVAGGLGLVAGFVALYAAKGAALHRQAGMVFFHVMLAMSFSGTAISAVRGVAPAINIPAALLTAYLVFTGRAAVRPPDAGSRGRDLAALGVALGVGLTSLRFGLEALAAGGSRDGMPAFPFFLFGGVGLLVSLLDLRMIRSGGVRGTARLARHLWRMCFALFIATASFFLGQADEIPRALRIPALLAAPVLAVPVTMGYWLWRLRWRRRGAGGARGALTIPEAA